MKRRRIRLDQSTSDNGAGSASEQGYSRNRASGAARSTSERPGATDSTELEDLIQGRNHRDAQELRNHPQPHEPKRSRVLIADHQKPRAVLTSSNDGVWLMMYDPEGNLRVKLGVDKFGLPALELRTSVDSSQVTGHDVRSVPRLAIRCIPDILSETPVPIVSLLDASGVSQAMLIADSQGESSMAFFRDQGTTYGWSLHSLFGLTRYTSRRSGPWGDGLGPSLTQLAEAEKILKAIRENGGPLDLNALDCLVSVYGDLLV
ncbi:MAG TPA: hypothetical protein VJX67_26865 [Blastocatellia bacterium]|nr:hypothetical protein [Blastocatellia bacterium]